MFSEEITSKFVFSYMNIRVTKVTSLLPSDNFKKLLIIQFDTPLENVTNFIHNLNVDRQNMHTKHMVT
jgi:hypothetical protein